MAKSHTFMTLLLLLFISSIATISSRPITLNRRGVSENCDTLLGVDCDDQWPFSPITSINPFISRPFHHRRTPPVLLPSLPPVVVASPPPTVSDPTFSPLVASPPPPGTTIPPTFPELPPVDEDTNAAPPFLGLSFSPPADANFAPEVTLPPIVHRKQPDLNLSPPLSFSPPADDNFAPEVTLPPIVHRKQPDLNLSPTQLNLPAPDLSFNVPPPPLVPIYRQQENIMPPPPTNK